MEQGKLETFIDRSTKDCRLGKGHLSVYMALYYFWCQQGSKGALSLYAHQVMPLAKVYSRASYCRIVIELSKYGYLKYEPSLYKAVPSTYRLD